MILQIWKYELDARPGVQQIEMPEGAWPLAVQVQYNKPVLWAEVSPDNPKYTMLITTVFTGQPFEAKDLQYIGTYQLNSFVFHVYRELR